MATHSLTWNGRRGRRHGQHAAGQIVQLLAVLRRLWRAAWASDLRRQPRHAKPALAVPFVEPVEHVGLTENWVTELHALNEEPAPTANGSGYYAVLSEEVVELAAHDRLMGATDIPLDLTEIDGWRLAGSLYDSLPGA